MIPKVRNIIFAQYLNGKRRLKKFLPEFSPSNIKLEIGTVIGDHSFLNIVNAAITKPPIRPSHTKLIDFYWKSIGIIKQKYCKTFLDLFTAPSSVITSPCICKTLK